MNKNTQNKLLNIVKNNYEEIADEFSNSRNYIWPELKKIITECLVLYRVLGTQARILDLGCGNGRLAELFSDKNIKYTGVDQSHNLIKLAKQKYPKANFIQDNIVKTPRWGVSAEKYNLILLIAVLPHIPSSELRLELLKNIKNNLAPNGKLIITCWNLRAQIKYRKIIYKYNTLKLLGINKMDFGDILFTGFNKKSERYYHAFTKNELKKLLIKAGFKIEKIYSDKKNIYITGV